MRHGCHLHSFDKCGVSRAEPQRLSRTLGDLKSMDQNLKRRILNSVNLFKNLGRKQKKRIKDLFKVKTFRKEIIYARMEIKPMNFT